MTVCPVVPGVVRLSPHVWGRGTAQHNLFLFLASVTSVTNTGDQIPRFADEVKMREP